MKTRQSGIYVIPNVCRDDHLEVEAYCDTINGGGGWLVVQRRQDGSVDFNRNWIKYEEGFGNLTGEFWYGLRALHCLTGQGGWEMRMDIKYNDGRSIYLQFEQFKVALATEKYNLTIGGGYRGTTGGYPGNSLSSIAATHNGMLFTTKDNDNDQWTGGNCTVDITQPIGGWWFNNCWSINPNHLYSDLRGITQGSHFVGMKIRPRLSAPLQER
ncbi:fibrinogen-like protein 1 [Dysidea avara]|uniref:fibrinogen-like protein 1 n=1 Tax=Dysidea avara TaxID=196820 RepID=UPI0033305B75